MTMIHRVLEILFWILLRMSSMLTGNRFLSVEGGGGGSNVGDSCPKSCFCNTASKIVYCSRRGLTSIPDGIPVDSHQLNLNGNRMDSPVIRRSNLSSYDDLEHLYMSECSIDTINVDAFADLTNLKWLDLSNNQIKVIQDHTFRGLSLQHLFLNGNRNIQLHPASFEGLATIGLYLHDCSLKRLHPDVLAPLSPALRNLWLNGNELERLDRKFNDMFAKLLHLRLGSNPVHCGCETVWLKEFFDRNPDIFRGSLPPSCLSPRPLKGRYFNEMSLFDLRCQVPQFTSIDGFFDDETGRLRCVASGEPVPVLYWIQPSGKASKFLPPNDEDATQNEASLVLGAFDRFHLSGMYICIANNEAGNVTLSMTIPWPPLPPSFSYAMPPVNDDDAKMSRGSGHDGVQPPDDLTRSQPIKAAAASTSASGDGTSMQVAVDRQSRLLGDSLMVHRSTVASTDSGGGTDYTRVNVPIAVNEERFFTVAELIWAIVGTHLLTLLLCIAIAVLCYKIKKARSRRRLTGSRCIDYCNGQYSDDVVVYDKTSRTQTQSSVLSESVYLNGLRNQRLKYYMDPRPASSDHAMITR